MINQLRKLGMIVEIEDGLAYLREPYNAAKNGEPLTPEQAKVLVHFEKRLAEFKIDIACFWSNGNYEEL
jgi:mRNA turnover protein 4